jgi:23S rRNA maturation mini-RNase III
MANIIKRKSYTIKEKLSVIERVKSGISKIEGSDVEMELEEEPVDVPTYQEALQGLETVIGWLEAQQDVEQVKIMHSLFTYTNWMQLYLENCIVF